MAIQVIDWGLWGQVPLIVGQARDPSDEHQRFGESTVGTLALSKSEVPSCSASLVLIPPPQLPAQLRSQSLLSLPVCSHRRRSTFSGPRQSSFAILVFPEALCGPSPARIPPLPPEQICPSTSSRLCASTAHGRLNFATETRPPPAPRQEPPNYFYDALYGIPRGFRPLCRPGPLAHGASRLAASMTSQQALFADTIIAMKKAMKRRAYGAHPNLPSPAQARPVTNDFAAFATESEDSEDDIDYHGNRGQKLKKRARFAREGQLAPPSGPEFVNHAGYTRAIISRNPPLVDDEGYEPESDDEDYEQRMQEIAETAAEFNPYASLRLENILAPLSSVTEIPSHPTLSRAYTSKTLSDLTKQAREILHKENAALWKVKHLHTKLVGDHVWVPCSLMETPHDLDLYQENHATNGLGQRSVNSDATMLLLERAAAASSTNGQPSVNGEAPTAKEAQEDAADGDTSMVDADVTIDEDTAADDESSLKTGQTKERGEKTENDQRASKSSKEAAPDGQATADGGSQKQEKHATNGISKTAEQNGDLSTSHGLQAATNGSEVNLPGSGPMSTASVDPLDEMFIHPIFLAPRSSQPNRDLGLPEGEAEDLRRLLQLYVQKQEEVCRGAKRLNEGLLRADRLRKTVFQWSKFEAHVGPNRDMSDGEDWYDKEEWGLDEDLKKGQDEEEEDTTQTAKKTRARR
ncbi:hypothetical protein JX266_006506 [Neoarthrinium moseri]|nr:hypothetical protein JX266_006506 [Neoarthrinium moseri]